jgi:hypothetical protein
MFYLTNEKQDVSRVRKVIHASLEWRPVKQVAVADDSLVCAQCLPT